MARKSFHLTTRASRKKIDEATTKPLPLMSLDDAKQQGLLVWLEDDYYQTYRKTMNENALLTPDSNTDISIAYTAMHGVGAEMAETLLADAGFKKSGQCCGAART